MIEFKENNIGFIGDLHFGKHNEDKWDQVYNELREWIVEKFKPNTKQLMFFGDIFDGRMTKASEKGATFKLLHFVDQWFSELSKDFEIYMFAGNHDCSYKNTNPEVNGLTLLRNKPNIHVIEDTTDFVRDNKLYRVVPWACELGETKVHSIFAHFDIQNFRLNAHKVSEHGYSSKELFEVCDHVYSGHYHHQQESDYKKKTKKIKYLGTPLQLDWGEANKESSVYLFDLSKNEIVEEYTNDRSPKHIKVFASELEKKSVEFDSKSIVDVIWDVDESEIDKKQELLEGCFKSDINFSKSKDKHFEDIKSTITSADPNEVIVEYLSTIEGLSDEKRDSIIDISKRILKSVI